MAIKYNLDRAIALVGFNRDWYFWNYIKPHGFAAVDAGRHQFLRRDRLRLLPLEQNPATRVT